VGPCQHGASSAVGWVDGYQMFRIAETIELVAHSQQGVVLRQTTPRHTKSPCYEMLHRASDLDVFLAAICSIEKWTLDFEFVWPLTSV
jgi:hypothetical protein